MTAATPTAYVMLKDSPIEKAAPKGTKVYRLAHPDYGAASLDTQITGVEHISVTLDRHGDYPFFTAAVEDLEKLEPEAANGAAPQ